jgi:16S rRNA (guanine527-N7)-methyltransferase
VNDPVGALPEDVQEALRRFERLLMTYSPRLGLLSPADLDRIWERHIVDSLRALACLEPSDRILADVGSGAGLPGIPVAIARPDIDVVLIEPMRRRAGFLELVVEQLNLSNARIVAARAEEAHLAADVVLARAFASPLGLWAVSESLLGPTGRVVYFAGASWQEGVAVPGATMEVCLPGRLAWEGPLVIMRPAGRLAEDGS